jgi:hypothetical protein
MSTKWIKPLFVLSGIYDLFLGVAALLFGAQIFRLAGVTPSNHIEYVQFSALLVILFGVMFLAIAKDPQSRREWILLGMGLKASYFGVVFWHELLGGIPKLWIPGAWADLIFFLLFLAAWRNLRMQ